MEQHRQHRMREEQRMQQQYRNRINHQQRHLDSLCQERRQDQLQLQLQLSQEHRARQQQAMQERELAEMQGDLHRKLLRSSTARDKARLAQTRSSACSTQLQQPQPPQEQPWGQRQQDRVLEQIQRLALLGNIEALFAEQATPARAAGNQGGLLDAGVRPTPTHSSTSQHDRESSARDTGSPPRADQSEA